MSPGTSIEIAYDTDNKYPPSDQHEIAKDAAVVFSTEAKEQLCASGGKFNPEREEIGAPMRERVYVFQHQPIVASSCARKRRALAIVPDGSTEGNVRDGVQRGKNGDPAET